MKVIFEELNDSFDLVNEIPPLLNQISTLTLALNMSERGEVINKERRLSASFLLSNILDDVAEAIIEYHQQEVKDES
jgi:hypothetical protein